VAIKQGRRKHPERRTLDPEARFNRVQPLVENQTKDLALSPSARNWRQNALMPPLPD
jgi:hypothetical protein